MILNQKWKDQIRQFMEAAIGSLPQEVTIPDDLRDEALAHLRNVRSDPRLEYTYFDLRRSGRERLGNWYAERMGAAVRFSEEELDRREAKQNQEFAENAERRKSPVCYVGAPPLLYVVGRRAVKRRTILSR
jgi:hypothetical protein